VSNGDPQRWEYRLVGAMHLTTDASATELLNDLGSEGWELVAIDTSRSDHPRYVFKRPSLVPQFQPEPEPDLEPEDERWLRNVSAAQALLVLPEEERDELLNAVLTDDEKLSSTPPDDFHERVQRYFAEKRQGE
jgi:hypothetical protein